jgi:hypothetical protein
LQNHERVSRRGSGRAAGHNDNCLLLATRAIDEDMFAADTTTVLRTALSGALDG